MSKRIVFDFKNREVRCEQSSPSAGEPTGNGYEQRPAKQRVTRRFEFPHGLLSDGEHTDITVFSPTIEFRAQGKPDSVFDLATSTWEVLGQPREIDVTVEAVVA